MYHYLRPLVRYAGVILLLLVLGGATGLVYSLRQTKVYTATATLQLNPSNPAPAIPYLKDLLSNTSGVPPINILADTYGQYLLSPAFDARVIQKLHLNASTGQVGAAISSWLTADTNYFNIAVNWDSPEAAAALANALAQTFIDTNNVPAPQPASSAGQRVAAFLRDRINNVETRLAALLSNPKADQNQITALENQLIALQATYDQLAPSRGATGTAAESAQTAAFVAHASPPTTPILPHTKQNTMAGLLGGLLIGLVLVYVLESLDRTVRGARDLVMVNGVSPLGMIGRIQHGRSTRRSTAATSSLSEADIANPQLVMLSQPDSVAAESFRALRTNLEFSSPGIALKSLVITGWQRHQGSSTIAANLAIALAQIGKRVILVDADLYEPALASLFGIESTYYGLTSLLNNDTGEMPVDQALYASGVQNLRVLPAGAPAPNPAERIASASMATLLSLLEQQADLVILDTPPLSVTTDAVTLAARASGTVFVVRTGAIRRELVTLGIARLRRVGAALLGIVLNDVPVTAMDEGATAVEETRQVVSDLDMRPQDASLPYDGSGTGIVSG